MKFMDSFYCTKVWKKVPDSIDDDELKRIIHDSPLLVIQEDIRYKVYRCYKDRNRGWIRKTYIPYEPFSYYSCHMLDEVKWKTLFKAIWKYIKDDKIKHYFTDKEMLNAIMTLKDGESFHESYRCKCGAFKGLKFNGEICPICRGFVIDRGKVSNSAIYYTR